MKLYYDPKLKALSRDLRKQRILAEVLLWNKLKGRRMLGYQFARQKPIGATSLISTAQNSAW
jgi:very-short-patch-repair endonuclease